jgi:hypothetical protein
LLEDHGIHHRIPLEWSHLFPGINPNALKNLFGMSGASHDEITAAWNAWRATRLGQGLTITATDVTAEAAALDSQFLSSMIPIP